MKHSTPVPNHVVAPRSTVSTREVLEARLQGLPLPQKPRRGLHWRIPSEVIDRAMAMVVRRGKRLALLQKAA